MKRILFVLSLILSLLCTVQAGYIIRSSPTWIPPATDLRNFTLTFDATGRPIAAASLNQPSGMHGIVIVRTYSNLAHIFSFMVDVNVDIVVRDFQYVSEDGTYLLCGSRGSQAFVASINSTFTTMQFMQYPEADEFYSISGDYSSALFPILKVYVCGKKGHEGIIATVNRSTLQLTSLYETENWVYHKIITKQSDFQIIPHIVVSGRSYDYNAIGFTEFDALSAPTNVNKWEQNTDPASLCVVSSDVLDPYKVILASSHGAVVTLTPVTLFPVPIFGTKYQYTLGSLNDKFCVQDIDIFEDDRTYNIRISVAGYMIRGAVPTQYHAWHGYMLGLSGSTTMYSNNYYGAITDRYEHYKVKYRSYVAYTGGSFQNYDSMNVLFATPRRVSVCDYTYSNSNESLPYILDQLPIFPGSFSDHPYLPMFLSTTQTSYTECPPFKGEEAPEMVIAAEDESEVIAFNDCIIVKDIPNNTNYQIYNAVGQLIQVGTTNPNISIAQLDKGIYILRLENGKAFKFVK